MLLVSVPEAVNTDKSPPRDVLCQNEDKNCSCCCSRLRDEQNDEFYHFGQNVACQLRKLPLKTSLRAQLVISRLLAKERLTKRVNFNFNQKQTDLIKLLLYYRFLEGVSVAD